MKPKTKSAKAPKRKVVSITPISINGTGEEMLVVCSDGTVWRTYRSSAKIAETEWWFDKYGSPPQPGDGYEPK